MNQFTGTAWSRCQKICHIILNHRLRKFKILFWFTEKVLEMLRGGSTYEHLFRPQNEIMGQRLSPVLSMQWAPIQAQIFSVTCHLLIPLHPASSIPIIPTAWCSSAWTHWGRLGVNPNLPSSLANEASANHWASLCLKFLICKMGVKTDAFSHVCGEDWMRSWDHVIMCFP